MLRKILFTILAFVLALIWQTPASIADKLLREAGQDQFALLGAEGSLWSGKALLAVPDPASARFVPILHVSWNWQASALLRGQLRWGLNIEGKPPAEVVVGFNGPSAERLELDLPARYVLERIPNAFGRAGWHGDLRLSSPDWHCDWRGRCSGQARLAWMGVASDLFPRRRFGDYVFEIQGKNGILNFDLKTLAGDIQIQASGLLESSGRIEARGFVQGEPAFVGRLPSIAGNIFHPEGPPGRMVFDIKQ